MPARPPKADAKPVFPTWGAIALPGCLLWGTLLGLIVGVLAGNALIGTAIGAGLGIGIGLALFAAAIVVASSRE